MEELARRFASLAHEEVGQRRKYTGEPYIVHPAEVVELVRSVPHTEAMILAAWCHDTLEDTEATITEVEALLGAEVASLVEMLTVLKDGDPTLWSQAYAIVNNAL